MIDEFAAYSQTVKPVGRVVPLADLKDHLHYLSTDQDQYISALHDMAVARIELETRRQLLTATWELRLPCFPSVIELRKCPVASVSSIKYLDQDGVEQTLATSVYSTFLQREPAEIHLAYSQSWPTIRETEQSVTVTFVAGYGADVDCPAAAHHLVKLIVQDAFEGTDRNEPTIERLMTQLKWGM